MAFDGGVVVGRDVHVLDGEVVVLAGHARAGAVAGLTSDALAARAAGTATTVALRLGVLALVAAEVEATVLVGWTVLHAVEIKAILLLRVTLGRAVLRGAVRFCVFILEKGLEDLMWVEENQGHKPRWRRRSQRLREPQWQRSTSF